MEGVLVVILGPTASGKTEMAVRLAEWLNTDIISADSRQFYREMKIGTAPPDALQLARARHHFVGSESVLLPYDVARYESDVLKLLDQLFSCHRAVIMAGGSGLYIDAVCRGIDAMPGGDPVIRKELEAVRRSEGIKGLQQLLQRLDPEYYSQVDVNNPARLLRALEVCRMSGMPYSSFRKESFAPRPFRVVKVGLEVPRAELIERINLRVDAMMAAGLLEEVRGLLTLRHLGPLNTVGYSELFEYLEGHCALDEAVERIRINTRRYAKRQMTWFRKDPEIKWVPAGRTDMVKGYLESIL